MRDSRNDYTMQSSALEEQSTRSVPPTDSASMCYPLSSAITPWVGGERGGGKRENEDDDGFCARVRRACIDLKVFAFRLFVS